jgi:hypothetical protein
VGFGIGRLVVRNFCRSPLRASMTVMTVAIMPASFIFPRALVEAQEEQVRQTPNNRVNVSPKEGWGGTLPLRYTDQIRELPGVRRAYANQALSLEDRVAAQANMGNFSAITTALDVVSYLILAVVMSIVGNTLAMNVRERTHEYGVMRAIGFGSRQLGLLVLAEAALFGLLGGAMGPHDDARHHRRHRARGVRVRRFPDAVDRHPADDVQRGQRGSGHRAGQGRLDGGRIARAIRPGTDEALVGKAVLGRYPGLGFAILAGTAVGAIGGLVPAIRAARVSPVQAMRA